MNKLVDKYLTTSNFACFNHNNTTLDPHDCVYVSADYTLYLGDKNYKKSGNIKSYKDNPELIKAQMSKYRKTGYPANNGMIISGVLLMRHNEPDVIAVMNDWWQEIKYHSHLCQLSFNYVAWKNNFKFNWIDGDIRNNKYFKKTEKHRIKRVKPKYAPIDEEYFLNMELQSGHGGKEIVLNNYELKTVRDVIEYWKTAAEPNLIPENWQYYNTMQAKFRHDIDDHHKLGWDQLTKEYFQSKSLMTDQEIEIYLMANPVGFGNGYIKHGWHRACAMIGRSINEEKYIPFYMEKKYIYDEIRDDDGKQRVFPLIDSVNHIEELDKIGLSANEYAICQSAVLSTMAIRSNDDIDIIISSTARNRLFNNSQDAITIGKIEMFGSNNRKFRLFNSMGDDDLIENYTFKIDGRNFLELRFYLSRKNRRTQRDLDDWKGIENFFNKKRYLCYPFSDITLEQWGVAYL